jgi:hypothetical protein
MEDIFTVSDVEYLLDEKEMFQAMRRSPAVLSFYTQGTANTANVDLDAVRVLRILIDGGKASSFAKGTQILPLDMFASTAAVWIIRGQIVVRHMRHNDVN